MTPTPELAHLGAAFVCLNGGVPLCVALDSLRTARCVSLVVHRFEALVDRCHAAGACVSFANSGMALAYGTFAKGKELAVRSLRIDAAEEILPLRTDKLPPRRASALLYVQPHPAMKSAIWRSASVLRKPVAQRAGTAMTRLFASREHAQYGGAPIVRKNTNQHGELRDSFKCVVVSAPTWRGDFGVAAVTESGMIVFYEHNFDRKQREIYLNKGDHLSPTSGTNCLAVFASDPENA